jgi:hypothetical protein
MSYAGTYGADETCRHDSYWRSCALCSLVGPDATPEQIRRAQKRQAEKAEEVKERTRKNKIKQAYEAELIQLVFDRSLPDDTPVTEVRRIAAERTGYKEE